MCESETSDLLEDLSLTPAPSMFTEDELKDICGDEHHGNETAESSRSMQIRGPASNQGILPCNHWTMESYYYGNSPHVVGNSFNYAPPVRATVDVDGTSPTGVGFDTVCDPNAKAGGDAFVNSNTSTSELCQPASTTDVAVAVNEDGRQKRVSRKTPLRSRCVEEAGPSFSTGGGETTEVPTVRRSKRAKAASLKKTEEEETSAPLPKLFKYQMDTPDAKPAKASKITRDKKKAELESAKATIKEQKDRIAYLENKLQESEKLKEEFRQQVESNLHLLQEGPQVRQTALQMLALSAQILNLVGTPVSLVSTTVGHPEASVNERVGVIDPNQPDC